MSFACTTTYWRPSKDVVSDFYGYAQILDPTFKRLRASKAVNTVRGEVIRLEPGKVTVHVPPASTCCWGGGGCFARAAAEHYARMGDEVTIPADVIISATGFQNRDCAQLQKPPTSLPGISLAVSAAWLVLTSAPVPSSLFHSGRCPAYRPFP
eukprot:5782091-Prymnesium_polylepis.1